MKNSQKKIISQFKKKITMYLLLLGCRYGHEKAVLFTTKRAAEAEYNLLPNYATDKHEWDKENSQIMEIHYEV